MRRLERLIWGDDLDPAIRPLLAVGFCETLAGSAVWTFVGIWAIKELGASQTQLAFGFLFSAVAAIASGWIGGHLSDHVGRRPVMLVAMVGAVAAPLAMMAAGHHVYVGLAVSAILGVAGAAFNAGQSAMVADLLAPERREEGYAAVRVANNLAVCFGPPLGGLLLLGTSWSRLFAGVALLAALSLAVAVRLLPRRGLYAPESPPERSSFEAVRHDYAFLLFLGSSVLASMTYVSIDALLPISLATSHDIAPSIWGFLIIINAGLVVFAQLRITRATARYSPAAKLAVAMPLMGFPFVALWVTDNLATIAVLMVVFVVGEMLWVPTSQAVVARFAPPDIRGAYMGVYGSAGQAAWALTPFLGLEVRNALGDAAMWGAIAAVSLAAGVAGAVAASSGRVAAPLASPA